MPAFNKQTTVQEIAVAYPGTIEGRTYFITGATSGLGLAFAKFVAQEGAGTVVLTGRSKERLAKAFEEVKSTANLKTEIKCIFMDMESHTSVRAAADQITSGAAGILKIDVLVNNAGILGVPYKKIDGYESQFFCNYLSHYLFTNLIMSHITSPGGRIISVTSNLHKICPVRFDDINFKDGELYDKMMAYGQSKTANILFAVALNRRLSEAKGIQGFSVHPGGLETGLQKHLDLVAEGYKDANGKWKNTSSHVSMDCGIASYLYAAVSPELNGNGGSYITESQVTNTAFPMTEEDADRLWKLSNGILETTF